MSVENATMVLVVTFVILFFASILNASERSMTAEDWLNSVHCTTLLRVEQDRYIVADGINGAMSLLEIQEVKRAIENAKTLGK